MQMVGRQKQAVVGGRIRMRMRMRAACFVLLEDSDGEVESTFRSARAMYCPRVESECRVGGGCGRGSGDGNDSGVASS